MFILHVDIEMISWKPVISKLETDVWLSLLFQNRININHLVYKMS